MFRISTLFLVLLSFLCLSKAEAVQELVQSGATTPVPFLLVDASTGQIGQTGQASNCTVTVCKPGTTSFVASSGSITELGNGDYQYVPTSAETGSGTTEGFLLVHVTDSTDSTQVVDVSAQVVAFNPNDATILGLSNVATLSAQSSQTTSLGTINTDTTASAQATDTQTGLTNQGLTTAVASALATTNTDVPLIYTQTSAANQQSNVTSGMTTQGYTGTLATNIGTTNTTVGTINTNVAALPSASSNATAVWAAGTRTVTGGTVASVSGSVGSISGITFPSNFGTFSIDSSGRVTLIPADVPPATSAIASAILATPAYPIATNSSGYVTATNGGGTGTVSGYSAGEDPATLVLGALASSWNTANTIGYKINNTSSGGGSVTDSSVQTDVATALSGIGINSGWVTNVSTSNTDVPLIYTQTLASAQQTNVIAGVEALPTSKTNKLGKYAFNASTNVLTLYADDGTTVNGTVTLTVNGSGQITSRM